MKRRDLLAALPATMLAVAAPQSKQNKKAAKAPAAVKPSPEDMKKDKHMLAMMILMSYRQHGGAYPNIDLVKNTPYASAPDPFNKVLPEVYNKIQTQLNQAVGSPAPVIKQHQVTMQAVSAVTNYPNDECPYGLTIGTAVTALLA